MFEAKIDSAGLIGLGTYRLYEQTYSTCRMALEMGYRHIDTAALYKNEVEVARAIAESGIPRKEIFITSKIPLKAILSGCIRDAARQSLKKLGTIDLLLLHAPGADPLSAWEVMLEIREWEEIGDVGVSNFNIQHLQLLKNSPPKWNQFEISPFLQRREVVSYCHRQGIKIVAHSPLVKGQKLDTPELITMANNCGCTPAQLLLAWSINKGFVTIPRSSKREHLQVNLEAKEIILPTEVIQELNGFEEGYATHPQHC
ncbi:aldo/keto reductase family protein [Dapis sp. BLCC M126]|uniref:aldo/keto reductase family protein n=1 Tax=Dapis sp. BLCC M126 TaxID=3400189 RepID=UPI003CF799C1